MSIIVQLSNRLSLTDQHAHHSNKWTKYENIIVENDEFFSIKELNFLLVSFKRWFQSS
jgi:hypothetical protein